MQQQPPAPSAVAARKQQRAALVSELSRTRDELRRLKTGVNLAHVGTRNGRFLPVMEYAQLRLRIDSLKLKSRRLQEELRELRGRSKALLLVPPKAQPLDPFEVAQHRLVELRKRQQR
jgi:hypothetical protein